MHIESKSEKLYDNLMVLGCIGILLVGMLIVANPW